MFKRIFDSVKQYIGIEKQFENMEEKEAFIKQVVEARFTWRDVSEQRIALLVKEVQDNGRESEIKLMRRCVATGLLSDEYRSSSYNHSRAHRVADQDLLDALKKKGKVPPTAKIHGAERRKATPPETPPSSGEEASAMALKERGDKRLTERVLQ